MLISSEIAQGPTVYDLIQIWVERYKPQTLFSAQHPTVFDTLTYTTSPEGRLETVAKLHRSIIKLNCEFAATQACGLHEYALSKTNPVETKRIVQCTVEIYSTLLEFYKQSLLTSTETLQNGKDDRDLLAVDLSVSRTIELASLLEPLLLEYQDRLQISDDWSKIGFLTTYLNFSNVALLNNLNTAERIFVKPYFKFLEEQVALP